jgi:hypothetical protein
MRIGSDFYALWVPRTPPNLRRLLWYTLGTAHDFGIASTVPGWDASTVPGCDGGCFRHVRSSGSRLGSGIRRSWSQVAMLAPSFGSEVPQVSRDRESLQQRSLSHSPGLLASGLLLVSSPWSLVINGCASLFRGEVL